MRFSQSIREDSASCVSVPSLARWLVEQEILRYAEKRNAQDDRLFGLDLKMILGLGYLRAGRAVGMGVLALMMGAANCCAQQTGAPPPDAPSETKKDDSAGPVQQVQDKTKEVVDLTKDTAKTQLLRARDWESGLITGVYVGRSDQLFTLTAEQRREIYLRQTLTTPGAYGKRAFGALIDQARGTPSQWDDGWGGYFERWASREGQFITANTVAAIGNAKLGYEVRYDKCKCAGFGPRTKHAVLRNFLTYDRSEEHWRPQTALYGGAFVGGIVATTWKPSNQSYLVNAGYGVLGQAIYGTLLNFVTEFGTEINRKQGVR